MWTSVNISYFTITFFFLINLWSQFTIDKTHRDLNKHSLLYLYIFYIDLFIYLFIYFYFIFYVYYVCGVYIVLYFLCVCIIVYFLCVCVCMHCIIFSVCIYCIVFCVCIYCIVFSVCISCIVFSQPIVLYFLYLLYCIVLYFLSSPYVRRGLNPPHRVKSISMASFTQEEIDLIKSRGNQVSCDTPLPLPVCVCVCVFT